MFDPYLPGIYGFGNAGAGAAIVDRITVIGADVGRETTLRFDASMTGLLTVGAFLCPDNGGLSECGGYTDSPLSYVLAHASASLNTPQGSYQILSGIGRTFIDIPVHVGDSFTIVMGLACLLHAFCSWAG